MHRNHINTPRFAKDAATKEYVDNLVIEASGSVDAYTKTESDARYEPLDSAYTKVESDAAFVNVSGDTMSGDLTITKASPSLSLNKTTSVDAAIRGNYQGNARWSISLGSGNAETGSNSGSLFIVSRYADNGTWINDPLVIDRPTGNVTLQNGGLISGGITGAPTTDGIRLGYAGGYSQIKIVGPTGSIIDFGIAGDDFKARIAYDVSSNTLAISAAKVTFSSGVIAGNFTAAGSPSAAWGFDCQGPIVIPVNGTYDLATGSGLISILDDGGLAAGVIFFAYGMVNVIFNFTNSIGGSVDTAGKLNIYYNSGTGKYRFQNKLSGTLNLFINMQKARPST
jgi:hypothetical protein